MLCNIFIVILGVVLGLLAYILSETDNFKYANIFNEMFFKYAPNLDGLEFDNNDYPWRQHIRENYRDIREEFLLYTSKNNLPRYDEVEPVNKYVDSMYQPDVPWKVLMLRVNFINTKKMYDFPKTFKLLSGLKPRYNINLITAMFSVLLPGKHIPIHQGPFKGLKTYHIAIQTPAQYKKCFIKVNKKKYIWQEGHDMIFDDTYPHEAINYSKNESRVVLILDIQRNFDHPVPNIMNSLYMFFMPYAKSTLDTLQQIEAGQDLPK